MEKMIELNEMELLSTNGGSEFSLFLCKVFGILFFIPSIMAENGAAGHEIMGSK